MFGMIIFVNKKMKYHWIKNAFLLVKILSVPFSKQTLSEKLNLLNNLENNWVSEECLLT